MDSVISYKMTTPSIKFQSFAAYLGKQIRSKQTNKNRGRRKKIKREWWAFVYFLFGIGIGTYPRKGIKKTPLEEESGEPIVEEGEGEAQEEDVVEGVVDGIHGQGAENI